VTPETAQLIRPAEPVDRIFDRSWHAMPNNVGRARRDLLAKLREEGVDEQILDAVSAAVTEVATNTVYHAYVGRRIGQFRVTAAIEGGAVKVSVADDGSGFAADGATRAGHGLALVASVADRVETGTADGGGTLTTMWFASPR
jgi:anti-sigma regulatory factor (Ser/Thr protein kinase)